MKFLSALLCYLFALSAPSHSLESFYKDGGDISAMYGDANFAPSKSQGIYGWNNSDYVNKDTDFSHSMRRGYGTQINKAETAIKTFKQFCSDHNGYFQNGGYSMACDLRDVRGLACTKEALKENLKCPRGYPYQEVISERYIRCHMIEPNQSIG